MLFRTSASVIALVACTSLAAAADFGGPSYGGSLKDTPAPSVFSWTGFYIGAHAGLMTGNTQGRPEICDECDDLESFFSTDYDTNGGLFGGHVGYNYQVGSAVLGIEASYSGSNVQGDGPAGLGLIVSQRELDWLATVTGRLGYAMGQSLVYVKGGVAWGDVNTNVRLGGIGVLEGGETHVGWTAGLGFEHAITDNITARIEYAHIDLGSEDHALKFSGYGCEGSLDSTVDAEFDAITVGVNYKFH